MSSTSPRSSGPPVEGEVVLLWSAIALVLTSVVVVVGAHLALLVDGTRERLPGNPVVLLLDLARGRMCGRPGRASIAGGLAALLLVVAGVVGWRRQRWQRRTSTAPLAGWHAARISTG